MRRIRFPKSVLASAGMLVGAVVLLMALLVFGRGGVKQPLEFNHKIHADNGMGCIDCHPHFQKHASSGRPTLETCSTCHTEALGKSRAELSLLEYVKRGEEIAWNRLYRVPEDVYYSHQRHVAVGKIECAACHGGIGTSETPPDRPLKITMKKCMTCHERSGVSNDCIACHR